MLNYALSILFTISSFYPNSESVHKKFDSTIKLAKEHYKNNLLDKASSKAQDAHIFASKHNYEEGETSSLFVMAFLAEKSNKFEKAIPYYLELIQRYEEDGSLEAIDNQCKIYFNLGNIMKLHSKYYEAIKYFDRSIKLAEQHGLTQRLSKPLNNKINTYLDLLDYESAKKTLKDKSELLVNKNITERLKSLNQKGLILDGLKNNIDARLNYKEIIRLEKSNPTSTFSGTAFINIASSYYEEDSFKEALHYYTEALKISKTFNESNDIFLINLSYSKVYLATDKINQAIQYAQKAESLFQSVPKTKENIEIFSLLSDIHFELGNIAEGKKYAKTHAVKLTELIDRQQKITEIGNQYKMDYITTSYFSEKEKRRNTNTFIWVIVTMILSFLAFRLYQLYKKIMVGRLLRKEMAAVDFDLDDHL